MSRNRYIHKKLLKKKIIHLSFNASVNGGTYPSIFKSADVTPILKKSSKNSKDNYRPISISKNLPKVFENIMYKQMATFMDKYFLSFNVALEKAIAHNNVSLH